jgi:hypothetical protein
MKARECRNRSRPFFDWAAQQGLAAKLCQFVCQILRRRFDFMDNTYFVGEMLRVGLKTAHHSIDTASMKDKAVRTLICLVAQYMRCAFVDIAAHRGQPAIQLSDDGMM